MIYKIGFDDECGRKKVRSHDANMIYSRALEPIGLSVIRLRE
jgi:hypothetical protein